MSQGDFSSELLGDVLARVSDVGCHAQNWWRHSRDWRIAARLIFQQVGMLLCQASDGIE